VPRFFEDYSTRFGRKKREKKGIIFECEKGQDTLSVYILGTLLLLLLRVERAAPVSENFFLKKKKYARSLSFTARSDSVSLSLSASVSVCVSVCVCLWSDIDIYNVGKSVFSIFLFLEETEFVSETKERH
jgi:hypothetical protein